MITHDQYQMQVLLRRQTGLVGITDLSGCSRGTVDPARALELVVAHSFEAFGDRETVHYLRPVRIAIQRDWTRPAEDSQTTVGPRQELKNHHPARFRAYGPERYRNG